MSGGLPNDEDRQRRKRAFKVAEGYRTAHEVISAAMTLGLLVLGGFWLDKKYGWSPLFTICGACLGLVVTGVSLRQLLRRLDNESAQEKRRRSETERRAPGD